MWEQYQRLWKKVTEFFTNQQWMEVSAEALETFLGNPLTDADALSNSDLLKFYEWFIWDYSLENGKRVYHYFLQWVEKRSSIEDYRVFRNWGEFTIEVVQVKERTDREIELVNLLTGDEFTAIMWDSAASTGDIFIGRFLPLGDLFVPTPSVVKVPDEVYVFLHKRIEANYYGGFPGSLGDFLRVNGYKLEEWVKEVSGTHNYSGALLFEVLDYRDVLQRMRRNKDIRKDGREVENLFGPLNFIWTSGNHTAQIQVDSGEMLISCEDNDALTKALSYFSYAFPDSLDLLEEFPAPESHTAGKNWQQFVTSLEWHSSRDRQVAQLIGENMEANSTQQVFNAIRLWHDFCRENSPSYRKPETWAAAVELALREIDASYVRKGELERKYAVSHRTINQKYRLLKQSLAFTLGDHRYSSI